MGSIPDLPVPISLVSGHYFLFSVDIATYLRREHNICGALIGTLPQIPQQNVFLGLPLELMPEEARILVEKGVAYIVDDAKVHEDGMQNLANQDRHRYLQSLEQEGRQAALAQAGRKEQRREEALKKLEKRNAAKPAEPLQIQGSALSQSSNEVESEEHLFESSTQTPSSALTPSRQSIAVEAVFGITPATSDGLFPKAPPPQPPTLPDVPQSYPLFAHLHSKGYFLSPGLRFGCQYLAYPGDPLRFHSHFLAVSAEWDEEFDIMNLVAGGRLGTGVKKGFLIGGAEWPDDTHIETSPDAVRTFSFEWAGM
ncbi:tRNA-intron endonuclease, archaea type [Blastomyces gilchristii SLH14081]|uniref:tRNA-splicing endonuclease subunit Sen34 n=1 Tax=Blastomyces gilchristii (strain SLH14081) TaxID=559298 RepID=A0A179UBL7_BLAGS|nr:tRNA-intron endonuclease, archaea type [Blastomyces gilchristii SLH14081]OAT04547.1 tRNA-intron endonuclease, archaea type [Blastomyces gilchristii SLH14081]